MSPTTHRQWKTDRRHRLQRDIYSNRNSQEFFLETIVFEAEWRQKLFQMKVLAAAIDSIKFSSKSELSSRFFGRVKFRPTYLQLCSTLTRRNIARPPKVVEAFDRCAQWANQSKQTRAFDRCTQWAHRSNENGKKKLAANLCGKPPAL
ncbi:MAG: hypothetical protein VXW84_15395, partial [Verrucomicrobiota bacterium]|nr:hypothetical protein [Verrucomicrobiota bacterium]